MSSPFGTLQSGSGSSHKFPFIIVPVSPNSEDVIDSQQAATVIRGDPHRKKSKETIDKDRCIRPPPETPKPEHKKGADFCVRRTLQIQKQLNEHFDPIKTYPTLLQTFSAHDQLRRPAKLLYPNSNSIVPDREELDPGPILYNGVRMTEDNYRELLVSSLPKTQNRSRTRPIVHNYPKADESQEKNFLLQLTKKCGKDFGGQIPVPASVKKNLPESCDNKKPKQADREGQGNSSLQTQVDDLSRQLKLKDVEMSKLRIELTQVKESFENGKPFSLLNQGTNSNYCCQSFKRGLSRVEKQLEQLEERIEYGGDGDGFRKTSGISNLSKKSYTDLTPVLYSPPDFDRILRSTRELNSMAESNSMELCYNSGGATFKHPEALTLTMYKNGLCLGNSPTGIGFKSYSNSTTTQFIQDIYDGYFPSELQSKYPDGITLIVDDKRQVTYTKAGGCFEGKGIKLHDSSFRKPQFPKFRPGMKYEPRQELLLDKSSNSKESLKSSSSLKSSESNFEQLPDLIPTHLLRSHAHKRMGLNSIITLKLKNMATGKLYKLRVSIGVTVGSLLDHLAENLDDTDSVVSESESESEFKRRSRSKLELINILPFGSFTVLQANLKEYGITANSLLYFRPLTS